MRVVVDASNLAGAGTMNGMGLSLVPELPRVMLDTNFLILLPDLPPYHSLCFPETSSLEYFTHTTGFAKDVRRVKGLVIDIPRLARRFKADVCLSLGDLNPIEMPCPCVCVLHQALFLYQKGELGGQATWPLLKQLVLNRMFAQSIRHSSSIVVQTPIMARRIAARFPSSTEKINIILNPVPAAARSGQDDPEGIVDSRIMECGKPLRLLFLAAPYPHKNHAILPSVAEQIRKRQLSNKAHIFVTIDDSIVDSRNIRKRLSKYPDVITNLGRVAPSDVPGVLRASTALFVPTLVESYGIIYLEAMLNNLPILTSDRDFARWMCRDLALYFEPTNPISIVDTIEKFYGFPDYRAEYAMKTNSRLSDFPKSWSEIAARLLEVLCRVFEANA